MTNRPIRMAVRADRLVTMSHPVDSAVSAVRTHVEEHRAAFLEGLADWQRIPSLSAQPDHAPDVRRSAGRLAAQLKETGSPRAEVWEGPGAPAVRAEWLSDEPGAPTVEPDLLLNGAGTTAYLWGDLAENWRRGP